MTRKVTWHPTYVTFRLAEVTRAATTVRSDSGADRTACDAACDVSVRLRSPLRKKTKQLLVRTTGNTWPSVGKQCPSQLCGEGVQHQDGL